MTTPYGPQDGTEPAPSGEAGPGSGSGSNTAGPNTAGPNTAGPNTQPAYYRPGPSSGYYPQYPQNPFGPGSSGVPPQFSGLPPGGRENVTYPYGGPFPAGTGPQFVGPQAAAAARPGNLVVALILLLVPPVLFLVVGLVLALAPLSPDMFPPESGIQEALAASALTMEQFLAALRPLGVVLAVVAALYATLAVVSFLGKFGALVALAVLTILFDLFWLLTLVSAAANPVGAILPLIVLGTSVAGLWMMFSAPARAWFAARR